jgi:YD repeat-containing protein
MNSRLWATASAIAVFTAVGAYGSAASAALFTTGDIFASVNDGHVNHYTSAGSFIEQLNTGQGGFTTGMAFDGAGNLLVTNFSAGNITKFNNTGVIVPPNPLTSPGASPESIAFDSSGNFYVGRAGGQPQKYTASGTLIQTFTTSVNSDWLDLAADQTTLFYNDEGGTIRRWNTATNTALADFANNGAHGGTSSFALRILGNGDVLTAAGSEVLQYNSAGAFLGAYDIAGVDGFFALNLDPNGTSFWSGSFSNGTLYKFNIGSFGPNTSIQTLNTGVGSGSLFGVAVAGEITAGGPPPNTGIPEPATWAMMLIGFGGLGAMVRRHRRQSAMATA